METGLTQSLQFSFNFDPRDSRESAKITKKVDISVKKAIAIGLS